MVETISPVVHGGRAKSYLVSLGAHALGAALGGALLFASIAGLGLALNAPWERTGLLIVAAGAGVYALRELFRLPVPLPDLDRQVPDWWRTYYSKPVAAFLYGLGLGPGFFTYLSFGTLVAVALGAFVSGSPILAAGLGGAFGAARAGALLFVKDARTHALEDIAKGPWPRLGNGVVLTAIATTALLVA